MFSGKIAFVSALSSTFVAAEEQKQVFDLAIAWKQYFEIIGKVNFIVAEMAPNPKRITDDNSIKTDMIPNASSS